MDAVARVVGSDVVAVRRDLIRGDAGEREDGFGPRGGGRVGFVTEAM